MALPPPRRILVTGGAGFVGAATVRLLVRAGHRVRVLDDLSTGRLDRLPPRVPLTRADVRDRRALAEAVRGAHAVLHLAARPGVPLSFRNPELARSIEVDGTAAVVEAAWNAGVERLVYASSAAVYGETVGPVAEDHPLAPVSPYGRAKVAGEAVATGAIVLRYFNVYGAEQLRSPLGTADAPVVVRFARAAARGLPATLDGGGAQARDFVHVADVARANVIALLAPRVPPVHVFNIGTGRRTTIAELAYRTWRMAGRAPSVVPGPRRPGDVATSVARVGRAAELLGWRPRVALDEGLAEVVAAACAEVSQAISPATAALSWTLP